MANPVQQGLKPVAVTATLDRAVAEMANPVQQGLKPAVGYRHPGVGHRPKWLIQYNKD